MKKDVAEYENYVGQADFWDDMKNAQKISKQLKKDKDVLNRFNNLEERVDNFDEFIELLKEEDEETLIDELNSEMSSLDKVIDTMKVETLLSGEYDSNNVIMSIHSGAGGTEAQDWAEMLLRMYTRWAEKHYFATKIIDLNRDTEGGIKQVTLSFKGENAYGYLKGERGVHRLVRISPFDSAKRRHTSFASVDIMPEIEDDADINIKDSDIRIDTYRSSGAGGQHVNTSDSAVRITHIKTGVVVHCQNERSQMFNKETAMKMLMARLIEIQEIEKKEKIEDIQGNYNKIEWGSQIRSYVFHPYTMVKDHRTGAETANVFGVLDGDIDLFINAYLKYRK